MSRITWHLSGNGNPFESLLTPQAGRTWTQGGMAIYTLATGILGCSMKEGMLAGPQKVANRAAIRTAAHDGLWSARTLSE